VLTDTIGSTLGSFVYALTDLDTNAVSGANIRFNYASKPSGSSGDSLIIPSATTDVNGEARANVRLGTTVGTYIVNAADTNLNGSARTFTAIAMHGKPVKMNSFAGVLTDTIGAKINPFGIRIADRAGNFHFRPAGQIYVGGGAYRCKIDIFVCSQHQYRFYRQRFNPTDAGIKNRRIRS